MQGNSTDSIRSDEAPRDVLVTFGDLNHASTAILLKEMASPDQPSDDDRDSMYVFDRKGNKITL